jgi:hypothetical protein
MNHVLDGSLYQLVELIHIVNSTYAILLKAYFFERRTSKRRQNAKKYDMGLHSVVADRHGIDTCTL